MYNNVACDFLLLDDTERLMEPRTCEALEKATEEQLFARGYFEHVDVGTGKRAASCAYFDS